jgi:hypothetical protein
MKGRSETLDAVLEELDEAGAKVLSIEQSKHIKVAYEIDGSEKTIITSSTPSGWSAPHNARAEIRRALRLRTPGVLVSESDDPAEPESPAQRVRQAPHPMRSQDRTPLVRISGGKSLVRKAKAIRQARKGQPEISPAQMCEQLLKLIQDETINVLSSAVERRTPGWEKVIVLQACGFVGSNPQLDKAVHRLMIWSHRLDPEVRLAFRKRFREFGDSLTAITREYADTMPERARWVADAHLRAEGLGVKVEAKPWEWPNLTAGIWLMEMSVKEDPGEDAIWRAIEERK